MTYVTSWKRIGEARGEARGILKAKRRILELQVSKKFGLNSEDGNLIDACGGPKRLDGALTTILDATTKDEALQHIR